MSVEKWYIVEDPRSYIVGEGHQEATTDKHYAEWILKELKKQRELGMIGYDPVMREASPEETKLFTFDFEATATEPVTVNEADDDVYVNIEDLDKIEEDLPF